MVFEGAVMMQVTDNYVLETAMIKNQSDEWRRKYPKLFNHITNIRKLIESVIPSGSNNQRSREIMILFATKCLLYTESCKQVRMGRDPETVDAALVFVSFKYHMPQMFCESARLTLIRKSNSSSDSFSNTVDDVELLLRDIQDTKKFKIKSSFRPTDDEIKELRRLHRIY